jgi:hypothetical protein
VAGLGDELCEQLSALFQAVTHLLPNVSRLLLQALFIEGSCGVQFLASPPFSGVLKAPHPLCCVSFFIIQVFLLLLL